jgi:hypothetical protein
MKKLVVLVGFAAAIYGAKKLFSGKEEQASQSFGATGYASQPQG